MKRILAIAATLLLINSHQVLAVSARTVYSQDVDSNSIELKVWKGYGLTINFMPTGEIIKQVWIGDPTRFAFTSNGNLCPKSGDKADCDGGKATVIFVRQIQPIKFPVTSSRNGSTQITVLTNQKQYQFKLIPARGEPSYTSLVIKPDSEKPEALPVIREQRQPILVKKPTPSSEAIMVPKPQNVAIVRSNSRTIPSRAIQRNDANALAYGLANAGRNSQVKPGSTTWNKVQDAIKLLRLGKSRAEAISGSGVDAKVFHQLIEWGQR